jgi:hypothetical protein
MPMPSYGLAITARDATEKGVRSAEKRIGNIPKRVATTNRETMRASERSVGRSTRNMVSSFSRVERATARVFGTRAMTTGIVSRLGGIAEAGSAVGTGLGEAAASGGLLSAALGTVGVAASATVGILAAAAYGAFKLADGWAKGAASIGRTAEIIGVGTKAMQEFSAAAERVGVDKDKATGALGGLSQTLNDARYGRNPQALAVLTRLGVPVKLNDDGTVNVDSMLPALANAIQQQNSSGRRTVANALGIPLDALPAFSQGGKALSADMADAGRNAPMISKEDVTLSERLYRRHVRARQKVQRETVTRAGRVAAEGFDSAETWAARTFSGSVDRDFVPAARKIERASEKMEDAAGRMVGGGGAGRLSAIDIKKMARQALGLRNEAMRYGFSEAEAAGIAANVQLESGGVTHRKEMGGGPGRGLLQWTDKARKKLFRDVMGVDVDHATRDQQWRFLRWETQHSEHRNWERALSHGQDPASIGSGFSRFVVRPANADRDSAERGALAAAIEAIPVHVTVELANAPPGSRAKATAGRKKPAVSHAYQH